MPETATRTLILGHSPDPDDAFMHWALAKDMIDTGELKFEHRLEDIETLNRRARKREYEITALSIHAYAFLSEDYALLNHGASMGEGYGPRIVARAAMAPAALAKGKGLRMAIPGEWTSAHLGAQLAIGPYDYGIVEFDKIPEAVARGEYDAGLLIHEGQLTFQDLGLELILDLGVWWSERTGGLPLPLGGNAIRRDLGGLIPRVSGYLRESIRMGLEHRDEAVRYALQFGRGLDLAQADEFIAMYVNERTLDYGEDGREAVTRFLHEAHAAGLLPAAPEVEFVQ
ncbi:MAG TPA: MqnA/MqnD/SBP family protein [Planctomycetota bacterium]